MSSSFKLHRIVALLINAVIIGLILYVVIKTDSDKSPAIFIVYYIALIILNLVIVIILGLLKRNQFKIYRQILIGQLLFLIPLTFIVTDL